MPRRVIPSKLLLAARRLRRDETPAEAKLWNSLRDRRLDGVKFRRQVVIGTYIADFYCPASRLIIELDGQIHTLPDIKFSDHIRQTNLEAEGYTVIRFTNDQIERSFGTVLNIIRTHLKPD